MGSVMIAALLFMGSRMTSIPTSTLGPTDLLSLHFSCLSLPSLNLPRCLSFNIFKKRILSFTQFFFSKLIEKSSKMSVALQRLKATQVIWKCQCQGKPTITVDLNPTINPPLNLSHSTIYKTAQYLAPISCFVQIIFIRN